MAIDLSLMAPDFEVFTGAITPSQKDVNGKALFQGLPLETDESPHVFMVGSSTEQDLHGDTMMPTALADMAATKPGLSLFLNHDYTLPYSFFGSLLATPVVVQHDGVADLHLASNVALKNAAAADTYTHIKNGAQFGCSGGFQILEYAFDGDDWFAPLLIYRVQALEWSVVGIPANQRSWVEKGIAGLFNRMIREDRGEEALRLAPAYKSLYRNDYRELLKSLTSEGLRKDLEAAPVRPSSPDRLTWEPLTKTFILQRNGKKVATVKDVAGTMDKLSLIPQTQKSCSLKTSWPLAPYDTSWDGPAAEKQIFEWAKPDGDEDDFEPKKAKQCFLFCDDENKENRGAYKGPVCRIEDGKPQIVPKAVETCAGVLSGSMGGFKGVSDADIATAKGKIKTLYNRINKEQGKDLTVPWEKEEEKDVKPQKTKDEAPEQTEEPVEEAQETVEQIAQKALSFEVVEVSGKFYVKQADGMLVPWLSKTESQEPVAQQVTLGATEIPQDALIAALKSLGITPTAPQEDINAKMLKAWEHVLLTKAGQEFSKENKGYIQTIHDAITSMVGNEYCAATMDDGSQDDRSEMDGTEQDAAQVDFTPVMESLDELKGIFTEVPAQLTKMVEIFSGIPMLQAHVSVLTKAAESLDAQFKKAQSRLNAVNDDLNTLTNRPLGKPTNLNTKVSPVQDMQEASYEDMLSVNKDAEPFVGSLEEALKQTERKTRTLLDGREVQCRFWPKGVGGTVEEGVRPALTVKQKGLMPVWAWAEYEMGEAAMVPLIDDGFPQVFKTVKAAE